jgi:hypothetical protein
MHYLVLLEGRVLGLYTCGCDATERCKRFVRERSFCALMKIQTWYDVAEFHYGTINRAPWSRRIFTSPIADTRLSAHRDDDNPYKKEDTKQSDASIAALRSLLALLVRHVDLGGRVQSLNIAFVDDGRDATDPTASTATWAYASSSCSEEQPGEAALEFTQQQWRVAR